MTRFRRLLQPPGQQQRLYPDELRCEPELERVHAQQHDFRIHGGGWHRHERLWRLKEADDILFGTGHSTASNARRYIILLTDGDNTYNAASYVSGSPGSPDAACRPTTSPSNSDTYRQHGVFRAGPGSITSSNPGSNSDTRERQLDTKTKAEADTLKAAGVEIFIVGLSVCGSDDGKNPASSAGTYCSSSNIGNSDPDTVADQRLLKCIASSTSGTNDHYYTTSDPTQLSSIFGAIAQSIAFRLIK